MGRKEPGTLTPRQQRFVDHYCVHLDAARAAKEAGYSERTAETQGCQQLKKPKVKAAVDAILANDSVRNKRLRQKLLSLLEQVIDFNISKSCDKNGFITDFTKLPGKLIGELSPTKAGMKARIFSKEKASELLMRHLGMLNDKIDVTSAGQPININVKQKSDTDAIEAAVARGH